MRCGLGRDDADRGSAVVDFALVGGLLTLLFASVLQLGLVLHVRNTLVDSAAEGARYGARANRTPQDAALRTRELVAAQLSARYAEAVAQTITTSQVDRGGARAIEVRLTAPLPVIGLLGPGGMLSVSGHAFAERQ